MLDYMLVTSVSVLECFDKRSYYELFIIGCKYTAIACNSLVEQLSELCNQIVFRRNYIIS